MCVGHRKEHQGKIGWVPKHRSSWMTQVHSSAIPKQPPLVTPMLVPHATVAHKASGSWGSAGPVPQQRHSLANSVKLVGLCQSAVNAYRKIHRTNSLSSHKVLRV